MISIIIPANNEEGFIGACLDHILQSKNIDGMQVIVAANGCRDGTIAEAAMRGDKFTQKGWQFDVLDLEKGSKIVALNAGDAAAIHTSRVYVDADILITPNLIFQIYEALDRPEPAYSSGRAQIRQADSFLSERYARFWERLPFWANGIPGCGVYAVNAAGRARWAEFPTLISDDTFVRFQFAPSEMHGVPATYSWPITEGFGNLVRVRRRQDVGLAEVRKLLPEQADRMDTTAPTIAEKIRHLFQDPLGFLIYASVALTVRLPVFQGRETWDRGR